MAAETYIYTYIYIFQRRQYLCFLSEGAPGWVLSPTIALLLVSTSTTGRRALSIIINCSTTERLDIRIERLAIKDEGLVVNISTWVSAQPLLANSIRYSYVAAVTLLVTLDIYCVLGPTTTTVK